MRHAFGKPTAFMGKGRALLETLQGMSVPTKRFSWHPLDRRFNKPPWLPELIRLSRSICFDLRVVSSSGVNVGYPGGMTWSEITGWQTAYSASCVLSMPPYHFGGYTNTNPVNTSQDAAHLSLIQSYIDIAAAAGISVRMVWLDTEVFSAASPNNSANAAHNTALNTKFSQVYDLLKAAWPSAVVCYYGQGSVVPAAAENASTIPNAMTDPADSPYPWGGGWALQAWSLNPWDVSDVSAPYTPGAVTPWIGDAICPAMYWSAEPLVNQLCNQFSARFTPSKPIVPFLAMGMSRSRSFGAWTGPLSGAKYTPEISKMYGAMYDNSPYWNTVARRERWVHEMADIVLWPAIDDESAWNAEAHFIAWMQGMNS